MLQLITGPTALPIDIADARAHLRVPFTTEDSIIKAWVGATKDYAENYTRKQLVVARWKQVLDSFPGQTVTGIPYGQPFARPGNAIYLERGPVLKVVSIQYVEIGSGTVKTVGVDDSVQYVVDYSSDPVRITPVFGQIWPIPQPQIASVWVTFDAGYAAPITVDATADTVTAKAWPALSVDDAVRFSNSGGRLPSPLQPNTDYFVQSVPSAGVYKLAATSGGPAIDLTDAGTGTSFLGVIPDGITAWMKLRLGALYENREELAETPVISSLPFADRLLDGYRTWTF